MSRRVVITGYGAVASLGENADEIWQGLMEKRLGYQRVDHPDATIKAKFFALLPDRKERYKGFPKSLLKCLPDFAKNALVATREALTMAYGEAVDLDQHTSPFGRGVIIGTGWGGLDHANRNNNDYRGTGVATSFATIMSMNNAATAGVSMHWNMRGYQNSPTAACATGAMAIGDAAEVIRSGRAEMMIAGGSESLKEQFNVWSIDVIQALSKEQQDATLACAPFDKRRSGFVLAEGAAVLVLESYEHAKARGARILGELTGYANYSDAFDMTAPAEDLEARTRTITDALLRAARRPDEVDYVNAHGTSTPLNDLNESLALKAAFGAAAYRVPISSTKSYTGHLIGAAGALESIFCLKALATGTVPATANQQVAEPECDLDYVPNDHRHGQNLKTVLNLSFGFGGANAALVFEKGGNDMNATSNLAFNTSDIAQWATFAGDFNPIHFDRDAARLAGSDDVIVHGMLAVLQVKEDLAQSAATGGPATGWRLFKSRFKRPVPAFRNLSVNVAVKAAGVGFSVGGLADNAPHIQDHLGTAAAPAQAAGAGTAFTEYVVSGPQLAHKLCAFRMAYPDIRQPWVALDALVFSEFLGSMLAGVVERTQPGIKVPAGLAGMTGALVVQTSHAVHYDAARLGGTLPLAASELRCRVRQLETLNLRHAVTGTVSVECLLGGAHAMTVEIGLMIIWPAAAAAPAFPVGVAAVS